MITGKTKTMNFGDDLIQCDNFPHYHLHDVCVCFPINQDSPLKWLILKVPTVKSHSENSENLLINFLKKLRCLC